MAQHTDRARRALAHLADRDPALAALALWCRHRDGPGTGTETLGETILYGAAFPTLPLPEQVGLAGHHVLHVALRHGPRAQDLAGRLGSRFDCGLYNLAADAIVNECLLLAGHALPRPCVRLSELLEETLGAEPGEAGLARWEVERLYFALVEARPSGSRAGGAGEGQVDGGAASHAAAARAYAGRRGFAEDLAPGGAAQAGSTSDGADWQGRLAQALSAGRTAGRGIARYAASLADAPLGRVPWEVQLRGLLARAVDRTPQPSHRRPSGAWIAREAAARATGGPAPVFEPGFARQGLRPRIAVGYDTSGSIDDGMFARFAGEVTGLARRSGAELHLLAFDETVHEAHRVQDGSALARPQAAPGQRGGGTSFVDVLERAGALAPSAIVVLTDLDGRFPDRPPRPPVIWVAPHSAAPPPFGRLIDLGV